MGWIRVLLVFSMSAFAAGSPNAAPAAAPAAKAPGAPVDPPEPPNPEVVALTAKICPTADRCVDAADSKNICTQPDWPMTAILGGNPIDNPGTCVQFKIPEKGLPEIPFYFKVSEGKDQDSLEEKEGLSTECAGLVAKILTTKCDQSAPRCPIQTTSLPEHCSKQIMYARAKKYEKDQAFLNCQADPHSKLALLFPLIPPRSPPGKPTISNAEIPYLTCERLIDPKQTQTIVVKTVCPQGLSPLDCVNDHTFSDAEQRDIMSRAGGPIAPATTPKRRSHSKAATEVSP